MPLHHAPSSWRSSFLHNRLPNYRAYNIELLSSGHTQLISSLHGSLSNDQLLEFERYFHLVCSAIARRVLSPWLENLQSLFHNWSQNRYFLAVPCLTVESRTVIECNAALLNVSHFQTVNTILSFYVGYVENVSIIFICKIFSKPSFFGFPSRCWKVLSPVPSIKG